MICLGFFSFQNFGFLGCYWEGERERGREGKREKMVQNLSVALYISGTVHHMIFIYGTRVKI